MESLETSPAETTQKDVDISRIEAMVTPEQVFSANVARKRRSFTKKQSANFHRTREQTPARDLMVDNDINEDIHRETTVIRPTTPERPRRKTKSVERNSASKNVSVERESSIPKNFFGDLKSKTENFAELAQNEFNSILNKTKKGISSAASRGRKLQRRTKKDTGRSLSAPYQFTEEEIMESFRRNNLINGIERSSSFKRLSNTSSTRSVTPEADIRKPRAFRPEVQELFRQRRRLRSRSKSNISNKIIEILDPETKNVIHTKTLLKGHVGLKELLIVLKTFKIGEIREEYKTFKVEMQQEILRIKNMRNSCFNELFIVILFCSIGGFLFKFTEGSFENFYKCGVKRVKRDFIDLLWIKSHNLREEDWKSLARNRLRIFEEELHAAHEAGMTSYSGQRSWSFLNGIVYSITVISTIGYGHIYPTTLTGRALTIVYSLIGIPLFLLALTDLANCSLGASNFYGRLYEDFTIQGAVGE
ncbi:hypothetical protein WA026_017258 [Henosepilachna vigintioctopunctata]|uniref:Potassium channel domain-containing protein n=1 Tax=Henosepilachna vigintioctopunctata TaxID=420089 RepID=A0AAW1ULR7_9CUCU